MSELDALWTNTQMGNYLMTAVGIAIAHSNALRLWPQTFGAPISIWIK